MNLVELAKELDAEPMKLFVIAVEKELLGEAPRWQTQIYEVDVPDANVEQLRALWYETSAAETLKQMEEKGPYDHEDPDDTP